MPSRVLVYVSKTDLTLEPLVVVAPVIAARGQADATFGLANWRELDVTLGLLNVADVLVNIARERDATRDGRGRWRWRTVAAVVRRWLGQPTEETCETCGQVWPTA